MNSTQELQAEQDTKLKIEFCPRCNKVTKNINKLSGRGEPCDTCAYIEALEFIEGGKEDE